MVDFSRYQPPGVYVEDTTTPLTAFQGFAVLPEVIGIVGPSVGYRTFSESVTFNTDSVVLAKQGIDLSSTTVAPVSGGAAYSLSSDYTLAEDGSGAGTPDSVTTLTRVLSGDITAGEVVIVTYRFADSSYFGVNKFTDYESAEAFYGSPLDLATNTITSPLTLAAKVAFENGASAVALVTVEETGGAVAPVDIDAAMEAFATDPEIGIVVPLPVGIGDADAAAVASNLASYLEDAVDNGNYSVGVLGYDTTVTLDHGSVAQSIDNERIVLAFPNKLNYYNGETNQTLVVSGYYLAAAYAGQLVRNGFSFPLTRRTLRSFAGMPGSVVSSLSRSTKDSLSSKGVAVTEVARNQSLVVRHGVTTDPTNVMTREVSLVRAKDAMVISLEESIENSGIVGTPITENTPYLVKALIVGALETVQQAGIIAGYRDVRVRQLNNYPDVIEAKFEYRPAYPLNYVLISFSVDVASGELNLNQTAA